MNPAPVLFEIKVALINRANELRKCGLQEYADMLIAVCDGLQFDTGVQGMITLMSNGNRLDFTGTYADCIDWVARQAKSAQWPAFAVRWEKTK